MMRRCPSLVRMRGDRAYAHVRSELTALTAHVRRTVREIFGSNATEFCQRALQVRLQYKWVLEY